MFTSTEVLAQQSTNTTAAATPMDTAVTIQKTATSEVDELPGHEAHQAVVALPERNDGKAWVGTVSWSASKPVELRLLQDYDENITADAEHGEPATAPFGNGTSAISLIMQNNGSATVPSFNSGSMNFAADQVAFHTLGGEKFTVTYTIDAEAKDKTS